ncbi:NUDIX domain-containing protein [Candidatus Gracilibacteria bacterium]|nr:NUDIX domain-containing protein [Candidatus Gracilibacteria bacterium]
MTKVKFIMVVNKEILFGSDYFQGFEMPKDVDYEGRILQNYIYMERPIAEENENYKQPIGYAIIFNPQTKKVFAYQRSKKDENYSEKRLQGKWSWGVGGHIEMLDHEDGQNPIVESMKREMAEEIDFVAGDSILLGYINDDSDAVGRVHFGMLYLIETSSEEVKSSDPEIADSKMLTIEELETMCNDNEITVENWSKIALEALKSYMSKL